MSTRRTKATKITKKRKTTSAATDKAKAAASAAGLATNKKFSLAGGGYCLSSPRFPRYLTYPGFADEVLLSNAVLPSIYALSFLVDGTPIAMHCTSVELEGGKARLTFGSERGLEVIETRFISGDDRFTSELALHNTGKEELEVSVVQWTTTDPEGEPVSLEGDSFPSSGP